MSDAFYDALRGEPDDARRVGWRHRIEQAYRFEVAIDVMEPGDVVLDVGCGLGALAKYLRARDIGVEVIGLERNTEFIGAIKHHRVIQADYRDLDVVIPRFDVAVAIGATSGSVTTPETIRGLLGVCTRAQRGFCLVAIDATRVARRAAIASDPSLGFVDPSALLGAASQYAGWTTNFESIADVELALFGWKEAPASRRTCAARYAAACDGPWGDESASRRAWLAYEVGLHDVARRELAALGHLDELGKVVADRLDPYS